MIRKDEKGYAMSGIGFLLLIPVIILIPFALSVQDQSTDLPTTFLKTDNDFRTYQNIQIDLNNKLNGFQNNVYGQFYNPCEAGKLAGNISALYFSTIASVYQKTYMSNNGTAPGTVDSITFTPGTPASSNHLAINNGNDYGRIPLKNGIEIDYGVVNWNQTINNRNGNSYNTTLYNMNITVNMTIDIVKSNTATHKNFYAVYGPIPFYVNSTQNNDLKQFFTQQNNGLYDLLQNSAICR